MKKEREITKLGLDAFCEQTVSILKEEYQLGIGEMGELKDELDSLPYDQTSYTFPADVTISGEPVTIEIRPEWFAHRIEE